MDGNDLKNIKMRTGMSDDDVNDNIKTFLLVFMAIIWRRVWITSLIYSNHNNISLSRGVVLKALKYNIFSPTGIGNTLKPYIIRAVKDGFLMPDFYEKNIYASRAVKLYKSAHEIIKKRNRSEEIKFLKRYAIYIHDKKQNKKQSKKNKNSDKISYKNSDKKKEEEDLEEQIRLETKDTIAIDNNNSDNQDDETNDSDRIDETNNSGDIFSVVIEKKCECKMCELVNSWDINLGLMFSSDPFRNVIMKGLISALDETNY